MTLRKFVLVSLLMGSASAAEAGGRFVPQQARDRQHTLERVFPQSRIVEFDLSYDFSVPGETHRIAFVVVLPENMPDRQNILSMSYSPKPSRVFHENGNRYAEFVFNEPGRQEKVKISIKAELFRYDLFTARKSRRKAAAESDQFGDFLKHEKYIEKDHHQVQEIAGGVEGETDIDIVKNIYDYVLDNM